MQKQVPILNIKMVPAGVELVLSALNKLPRENVDGLFQEINAQYQHQLQEILSAPQDSAADEPANEESADQTVEQLEAEEKSE